MKNWIEILFYILAVFLTIEQIPIYSALNWIFFVCFFFVQIMNKLIQTLSLIIFLYLDKIYWWTSAYALWFLWNSFLTLELKYHIADLRRTDPRQITINASHLHFVQESINLQQQLVLAYVYFCIFTNCFYWFYLT